MTAVEWFFRWFNDNPEATHKEYAQAFQQALEMEKQQIIDAYLQKRKLSNISKSMQLCIDAEKYYNETYKKEII
jgi:hypothetical protein